MKELVAISLRLSFIYVYALVLIRLSGKRDITATTTFDFMVLLIVSDLFDNVIWAEVAISSVMVAFATVIFLHLFVSFLACKSDRIHFLVSGRRTMVIRNGNFVRAGLRKERTNAALVRGVIRNTGDEKMRDVKEASWEPSGKLGVLWEPFAEPAQKRDLQQITRAR